MSADGIPNRVLESFALTIPPENIRIKQKQRKSETPTPGGIFIDNYGLGTADITISGTTSNHEGRLTIVGPNKAPQFYDGQQAYFELRNRIVRYSEGTENYTMRLYDLTHKGTVNLFRRDPTQGLSKYTEAWEVSLNDFDVNRSKAMPFFYPITIDFTGIKPIGVFNPRAAKNLVGTLSDIREAIDKVRDAISTFNARLTLFLDNAYEFLNDIVDIQRSLVSLSQQVTSIENSILDYEKKIGGLFDEVINNTETFLSTGLQTIAFPFNVFSEGKDIVKELRLETEELIQNMELSGYMPREFSWEESSDEVGNFSQMIFNVESPIMDMMRFAKQTASVEPVASVSINGINTPIYGFAKTNVIEGTSLDRLAFEYYGDPEKKNIISAINEIYSDDEMIIGTELKLPLFQPSTRYNQNLVYNVPNESLDLLGRDAKLDENGNFVFEESGDYAVTTGVDTVAQSIYLRLSEQRGRQVRNPSFGILTAIGNPINNDIPLEYLSTSLKETLLQDPRIIDVFDLNVYPNEDQVIQEFRYRTIDNEVKKYTAGI
jgi:hypothetical protein